MLTSYHVHSNHSDGSTSIRELVQAAIEAGLDEIGISDHYVYLPGGKSVWWSMPLDFLPGYFEEIKSIADEVGDKPVIRYGIEVDYDPRTQDHLAEVLRSYPFDYVIGSVHFVDDFPVDEQKKRWDTLTENERNDVIRKDLGPDNPNGAIRSVRYRRSPRPLQEVRRAANR